MATKWAFLEAMSQRIAPGRVWKPYVYETDEIAVDTSGNVTKQFSIQLVDQRPFIWCSGLYKSTSATVQAGTDVLYGGFLFKLDEIGGQGQGGKGYFMLDGFFGRGGITGDPRDLPYPVAFSGTSVIAGEIQNKTGASVSVRLSFIGLKAY